MNAETLEQLAALRACGGHSWEEIGRYLGISWQTARGQWRRNCEGMKPGPCPICGKAPTAGDRTSWKEAGNYAEGTAQHEGNPLSLEEFEALLGVDTDIWQAKDWTASRWQSPINRQGHLDFDKGVLNGHLDYAPGIQDLWSHRATFVRREPVALRPVVQPVECSVTYEPGAGHGEEVGQALLVSDLHIGYRRDNRTGKLTPFHDRRAISALLRLLLEPIDLDFIGILGDLLDLTNWNDKYSRSPEFYWTTQPAILEAHWILRTLRELAPETEIVLFMGNHENRIKRSLEKHMIEACELRAADEMDLPPALSPARLLALDKLGIEWVDDYPAGERWLGPLRLSHGDVARKPPGASARAVVEDSVCDNAFGHTHRLELVSKRVRTRDGVQVIKSLSTGCLCHVDGRVPPQGPPEHWQQGLVLVDYTGDAWSPTLISLDQGRAVALASTVQGQDYTEDLRADLPDWNW